MTPLRPILFLATLAMGPIVAHACDPPEKIGVEGFVTLGAQASLTWTGSEYGLAWIQGDPFDIGETNELWFARLDSTGGPITDPILVSDSSLADVPDLNWNGDGYGIVWRQPILGTIHFQGLDFEGTAIAEPSVVAFSAPPDVTRSLVAVAAEGEYGVAWENVGTPHFTLVDFSGDEIRNTPIGPYARTVESSVWNGVDYSVIYRRESVYTFQRIDADGTLVDEPVEIGAGPPHEFSPGGTIARRAYHVWNGVGYGAVVSFCETDAGPCDLIFVTLDSLGRPVTSRPIAERANDPVVAWNGSEYGVVWQVQDGAGTWFVRVSPFGRRIGEAMQITGGVEWQSGSRLVWNGTEYGVTFEPSQVAAGDSIWFGRVGCDCTDEDADAVSVCNGDCDDNNAAVFPGAAEANDGRDNQCPGDLGFGLIDETGLASGFTNATDRDEYSWAPQPGATSYRVARSVNRTFATGCVFFVVQEPYLVDPASPEPGRVFHYLNQSFSPNTGSWGSTGDGSERQFQCSD